MAPSLASAAAASAASSASAAAFRRPAPAHLTRQQFGPRRFEAVRGEEARALEGLRREDTEVSVGQPCSGLGASRGDATQRESQRES